MEGTRRSPVPRWLDLVAAYSWRLLLVAAALALIGYMLVQLRLIVVPLVVAIFLAALLMPLVDGIERRTPLPRTPATLLAILAVLAVLGGIVAWLIPNFTGQLDELRGSVEQGLRDIEAWLDDRFGITLGEATDRIVGGADGGGISDRVVSGAVFVGELVAGLLLAIVLCFFVTRDGPRFARAAVRWFPSERRDVAAAIGRRSWRVIGAYLRGVMITGVVDAVAIGLGLFFVGVPLVFSLMVLTFFGAFFPLVGAFLAGAVAVLVTLVANGAGDALIVLAIVIAVQQLEGDVVAPLVLGRALSLHPVVIVLALTAGAIVAGIVGAAFAVPLAAVVTGAIDEFRRAPSAQRADDQEMAPAEQVAG